MNKAERMKESETKFQNFRKELVKRFGEGAVITANQAGQVYEDPAFAGQFAKWRDFAKNQDFKLGRNQFVVTMSDKPAEVRDLTLKNMSKLQQAKESAMLPKATRQSPKKLMAAMGDTSKAAVAKTVKPKAAKKTSVKAAEQHFDAAIEDADSDNINDIIRTMSN